MGDTDLHILFGPNEAGKSTALAAVEDLLFGIPTRSPYGFLHDYSAMRIGALLQNGTEALEIVRRKGSKDTLLDADGLPLAGGEAALRPFLAGADRSFFERMFSLDHVRLETGGREILEAKDEVGQMLFAAGTGIAGLHDRLDSLSEEADQLWAARRAGHRKYYLADDKRKEAERELREHVLTVRKWQELQRDFAQAEQASAEVEREFERLYANGKRLGRIRRVYPQVRRKAELENEIAALGDVVTLPEDARERLVESEGKESEASARIEMLSGQLNEARGELQALVYDEQLVRHADDIERLHKRCIQVGPMRADLPARQAELEAEQARLRDLASELGWHSEGAGEMVARIPTRAKLGRVRTLLGRRGELEADVKNSASSLEIAEADRLDLQRRLDGIGEMADSSGLAAVIKAVRQSGDIGERVRSAEQRANTAQQRLDRLLSSLRPSVESAQAAVTMQVPPSLTVQEHRDQFKKLDGERRVCDQDTSAARRKLERTRRSHQTVAHRERAVTVEDLEDARSDRDSLWRSVKKKHIEGAPVSADEAGGHAEALDDLAGAFEQALWAADQLADRRFDKAEAVAHLAEIGRDIDEQEEGLKQLERQREALAARTDELDAAWQALWQESGILPRGPDAMLEWLRTRDELLAACEQLMEAASDLKSRQNEERDAKAAVLNALLPIDSDRAEFENQALAVVLERADGVLNRLQEGWRAKDGLQADLQNVSASLEGHGRKRARAEEERSRWRHEWAAGLTDLGLATDTSPDEVSAQIDVIDQMREVAGTIANLRHERIDKINAEILAFEQAAAATIGQLARDLAASPPDDAVLRVEERLKDAQRIQRLKAGKAQDIKRIEDLLREQKENRAEAHRSVQHLMDAAGVQSNDELSRAIEKSDRRRALGSNLDATVQELAQQGDGRSMSELEAECDAVDPDRVALQEEALEAKLKAARTRLAEAVQVKSNAEQAMHAVDGDAAAARTEAKRQEALAEIREVSERYVRVRSSAILLQWAIDRYRREKQAPLLKRAGELFATVTGRSFEDLRVKYDRKDLAYLTGLRPDGEVVPVSGMSSGTADQLYLALRVAAIEDCLDRSEGLPFVADDLFINFDDQRAGAGFRVLRELARKTQVLFFTHHAHLLDIAREALGGTLSVVDMNEDRAGIAG